MTWREDSPRFLPREVEGEAAGGRVSPVLVAKIAAHIWAARTAHLARLPVAEIVETTSPRSTGTVRKDALRFPFPHQ